jgi:hypothetical protein
MTRLVFQLCPKTNGRRVTSRTFNVKVATVRAANIFKTLPRKQTVRTPKRFACLVIILPIQLILNTRRVGRRFSTGIINEVLDA